MQKEFEKNDPRKAQKFFEAKLAFTAGPVEVSSSLDEGEDLNVVDVRDAEDYEKGHVPGAVSLPRDKWDSLEGLRKDAVNVVYCYSHVCHLGAKAAAQFASKGFSVMEMDGGFEEWKANDLEVEQGAGSKRFEHASVDRE